MRFCWVSVALSMILVTRSVCAEPLRVIDANNLLRAISDPKSVSQVEVKIVAVSPDLSIYRLSNVDGLKSDIQGIAKDHALVFDGVPGGTWKLQAPSGREVLEVKITDLSNQ